MLKAVGIKVLRHRASIQRRTARDRHAGTEFKGVFGVIGVARPAFGNSWLHL